MTRTPEILTSSSRLAALAALERVIRQGAPKEWPGLIAQLTPDLELRWYLRQRLGLGAEERCDQRWGDGHQCVEAPHHEGPHRCACAGQLTRDRRYLPFPA